MTPDIIIENNTDEPITWERDQDCDGYYLRDTATGRKIDIKAQEIGECRALKRGLEPIICEHGGWLGCREAAVVCMWKSAWGDPLAVDSWRHYCAEHARAAGLPA